MYHNTFCLSSEIFIFGVDSFAIGRKVRPERGLAGEDFFKIFLGTVVSHYIFDFRLKEEKWVVLGA